MTTKDEILVVDDVPEVLNLLTDLLTAEGFQVRSAESGELALRSVAAKPPHLILLDINMPDIGGFEVCRRLKAQEESREIPVIFISVITNLKEKVKGFGLGAVDFISKPFQFEELLARIRTHLELNRLRTRLEEQVVNRTAELRKSEESYRNLFENAIEAIFVAQDGKIVFLNPRTTTIFGSSVEELVSKPFIEFIYPDDRGMVFDRHVRRIKGEEIPHLYSFRIVHREDNVSWVELNVIRINWKGRPATLNFLTDITERKKKEEELKQSLEKLHKAMGGIIQVIARTVEIRDPYTAGHQKRVSNLARSIAQEIGMPKDQIEAVRMAGMIHDLGKISVPAEILTKSTSLSELEFELLKVHPQTSYDILKDIDFPWPIARIVLQHHERMDGSGYPAGLKGNEILKEAKIIMVADVVEAIASHRPYRPAHEIDVALDEIDGNKGILYDPEVVDACLRLFREKGFKLG